MAPWSPRCPRLGRQGDCAASIQRSTELMGQSSSPSQESQLLGHPGSGPLLQCLARGQEPSLVALRQGSANDDPRPCACFSK